MQAGTDGVDARQPQLHGAPAQDWQEQEIAVVSVFMRVLVDGVGGFAHVASLSSARLPVLNFWADLSKPAMRANPLPVPTRKRAIAGVGRVVVWPGASIWIGRHIGLIREHAHHAIQISLAIDGEFRVRSSDWREWGQTRGVVVQADHPHELDGCDGAVATLFVEPNSAQGAALNQRFARNRLALIDDGEAEAAVAQIREHYELGVSNELLARYAQEAICRIAGDTSSGSRTDPRITSAISWMRQRLSEPLRLEEVASAVHLSPGRFRHLFVAQTGTSFRAWLLWARAEAAIEAATHGGSWTDAAQMAGFSDAAHFTRTCRRVFGIAPTMLVFERQLAGPSQ